MAEVPVKSVRMLGGKFGDQLVAAGITKLGDIQPLDAKSDLEPLFKGKAQWVKNISLGICDEPVNIRAAASSASAEKTFKPIYQFESLKIHITLTCWDIISKVDGHLQGHDLFPTKFKVYVEGDRERFTKTAPMMPIDEYLADMNLFVLQWHKIFREALAANEIPFPCTALGASVSNFKPSKETRQQVTKISNLFKPMDKDSRAKQE